MPSKPSRVGLTLARASSLDTLWVIFPFFLLFSWALRYPLRLLDFWWHLKLGEVIVTTGRIPTIDLFSFTVEGTPFVVQNWVAEALYFALYRTGGFELLVFTNALLVTAALVPVYHLAWKSTDSPRWNTLVVSPAVVLLGAFSLARPQVFSILLFSCFLWILFRPAREHARSIWILPLLMLLWVNVHGAFVMGLILITIALCVSLWDYIGVGSRGSRACRKRMFRLAAVLFSAAAATLFNPAGTRVYEYVLSVMQDTASQVFVAEWQPPTVTTADGLIRVFIPLLVTVAVLLNSKRRPGAAEILLLLPFSFLALSSIRNSAWLGLIIPMILANHRDGFVPEPWRSRQSADHDPSASAQRRRGGEPENERDGSMVPVNCLLLLCMAVLVGLSLPWVFPRIAGTELWEAETPVAAMDYLEEERPAGRIFSVQAYGDYLLWRLWPGQRSFIDGRVHLFGEDLVRRYLNILGGCNWEQGMREFRVAHLLLSRGESLSLDLAKKVSASSDWELVYEDDRSLVFSRSNAR